MNVRILQHEPFEGIGSMAGWLDRRGAALSYTRFFEPAWQLPPPSEADLVIAMGGGMSVNDEAQLPWLVAEKAFLREVIALGRPVLGVCLGAQLIASALGATVRRNAEREIGWFPIISTDPAGEAFRFPGRETVFHWHGETFDLPEGVVLTARSEACAHQAFQIGRRVIGLQFHIETTPESAALLVENAGEDLAPGRFVQTAEQILAASAEDYARMQEISERLLDYLTTD